MPYDPEARTTADRRLAKSLLAEALAQQDAVPPVAMPRDAQGRSFVLFWDQGKVCTAIRRFYDRHGLVPDGTAWRHSRAHGLPSQNTMLRLFGSTNAGVLAAGLTPVPKRNGRPRKVVLLSPDV